MYGLRSRTVLRRTGGACARDRVPLTAQAATAESSRRKHRREKSVKFTLGVSQSWDLRRHHNGRRGCASTGATFDDRRRPDTRRPLGPSFSILGRPVTGLIRAGLHGTRSPQERLRPAWARRTRPPRLRRASSLSPSLCPGAAALDGCGERSEGIV